MGRLRTEGTEEVFNPGCEVDLARGELRTNTTSAAFTCKDLTRVVQVNLERIQSTQRREGCWSSISYKIDYMAKLVLFTEQRYVKEEGESNVP
jgi:hypothetical protein